MRSNFSALNEKFELVHNKLMYMFKIKLRFWSILIVSSLLLSCTEKKARPSTSLIFDDTVEIPEKIILKSELYYNHKLSVWTSNNSIYSGFAVSYYSDSTLKEKFSILNGRKHDKAIQWFPDGHLKIASNYLNGKLHGEKKIWSGDSPHILIAQFNYYEGKAHGVQKKWYNSGELYKRLHLNNGREEGLQQAFRRNGELYANYEAKNGRTFGMKKANLCYQLKDEVVVRSE